MRLTVDIIQGAQVFLNALNDREINLRGKQSVTASYSSKPVTESSGRKAPVVENLGATKDQCDVIDLSDNEIQVLENVPVLKRLKSLLLNNNLIVRIDPALSISAPKLEVLMLTHNRISDLDEIAHLAGLKRLRVLSLLDNPVVVRENYRSFIINQIPSIEFLDFRKVTQKERDRAAALFGTPKESNAAQRKKLTLSEKQEYEKAIIAASSQAEITRLERLMKAGIPLPR